jgi:hypothetical protein
LYLTLRLSAVGMAIGAGAAYVTRNGIPLGWILRRP